MAVFSKSVSLVASSIVSSSRRRGSKSSSADSLSCVSEPFRTLENGLRDLEVRRAEIYRRGNFPMSTTFVKRNEQRFLMCASPSNDKIDSYVKHLRVYNVRHIVRVSEGTCDSKRLREEGFVVHDWIFDDGDAPPKDVIDKWLNLVASVFPSSGLEENGEETIAILCQARLSRAPILVALAFTDTGVDPWEAIALIRTKRRGAINHKQMEFLRAYKRRPKIEKRTKSHRKILKLGVAFSNRKSNEALRSSSRC